MIEKVLIIKLKTQNKMKKTKTLKAIKAVGKFTFLTVYVIAIALIISEDKGKERYTSCAGPEL